VARLLLKKLAIATGHFMNRLLIVAILLTSTVRNVNSRMSPS